MEVALELSLKSWSSREKTRVFGLERMSSAKAESHEKQGQDRGEAGGCQGCKVYGSTATAPRMSTPFSFAPQTPSSLPLALPR